jgi:hypothetical protein
MQIDRTSRRANHQLSARNGTERTPGSSWSTSAFGAIADLALGRIEVRVWQIVLKKSF